jgi:hypothetical protein
MDSMGKKMPRWTSKILAFSILYYRSKFNIQPSSTFSTHAFSILLGQHLMFNLPHASWPVSSDPEASF